MREVYALRLYKSLFMYRSGLYIERMPFKDLYSLVDYLKDHHLIEKELEDLKEASQLFECVHYAPIQGGCTTIAYFQKA